MKIDIIKYASVIIVFIVILYIMFDDIQQKNKVLDKHSKTFIDSLRIEINALKDERLKLQRSIDSLQSTINISETDLKQRIKKLRNAK